MSKPDPPATLTAPPEPGGPLVSARVEDRAIDLEREPRTRVITAVASVPFLIAAGVGGLVDAGNAFFYAMLGGMAAVSLLPNAIHIVRQLRFARTAHWSGDTRAPTRPVRVEGVVEVAGEPPFPAPATGALVVMSRAIFGRAPVREEIRGVPFYLRLAGGTRVVIEPAAAKLLDEWTPYRGPGWGDAPPGLVAVSTGAPLFLDTIAPGDRIEAVGRLIERVDVAGEALPGRGTPTQLVLMPEGRAPVKLRTRPPR